MFGLTWLGFALVALALRFLISCEFDLVVGGSIIEEKVQCNVIDDNSICLYVYLLACLFISLVISDSSSMIFYFVYSGGVCVCVCVCSKDQTKRNTNQWIPLYCVAQTKGSTLIQFNLFKCI